MAWFKCGGGGIPTSLKSDMNDVLNKKFGTVLQNYPPDEWPGTVNLMGPLEEKTVSGSIVAFSDGADAVKLKSCEVTIAPTLDGVSSVNVIKGGYNFIDASTAESGNLNINTGNVDTTSTSWKTTDFMPLFAGDFIFTWVSSSTYFQVKWVAYDSNKTRIDGESTATWTSVYSKQFTFPTGTAFVRFCWSVVVSGNQVTREDIRLNRGTVDLGYTDYVTPTTHTANLGRTIHGGSVDVVQGTGTDENGNDFTFTPVPIISRLGDNTMWGDGDLSVVYRSSGTQTLIPPTLISKTITANGTYTASDEGADGFSSVVVDVPTGATNIETVLGENPLIEIAGVSGTDVTRTLWTRTAAAAEKIVFHPNTQVRTNTGSNDGYFKVLKNSVVVVSTYANTSTTTPLSIPDIDLEAGDVLTISAGFDNNHTSCWFDLYSTITILSSVSAPVLGLGNPGPVNEPEQEEPDAAPENPEEIQEDAPEEVDQNESNE